MNTVNERFASLVKDELDYTQKKASELFGVSRATLNRWMNGESNIPLQSQLNVYQKINELNGRWWFFGEGDIWNAQGAVSSSAASVAPADPNAVKAFYEIERTRSSEAEKESWELRRQLEEKEAKVCELEAEIDRLKGKRSSVN